MVEKRAPSAIMVLVVEDDPLIRMDVEEFLKAAGLNTISAANADEAIAILERRGDVRIVFTDIQMPGSMDGIRLAEAVRDRWPPVAIMVTSGQMRAPPRLPTNSLFFPKPIDPNAVVTAIRELTG
jgi:two-component system, response regulator PdtaR